MTRPVSQHFLQLVAQRLTPAEQSELQDILEYLGEKAGPGNPTGYMPEGSAAALFNRASPNVRALLGDLSEAMETPRSRPFEEKWTERDYAEAAGLDPDASTLVKSALDGSYVMSRLNDRLGTDADLPLQEPTTRDVIAAAMEAYSHE